MRRSFVCEDDGRGAAEAFARWREEAAPLVAAIYEVGGDRTAFRARNTRYDLPGASLTEFDNSGLTYTRDAARARRDAVDTVHVQLTAAGGLAGRFGERDVSCTPGSALFADSSLPLVNRSRETRGRIFILSRPLFGGADLRALHGRVVTDARYHRLDAYFTWLAQALPRAPLRQAPRVQAAMAAVVLATFRPEDDGREAALDRSGAFDGVTLRRLRALAADPARGVGLDAQGIAGALGVSRATLYRVAAPHGGVMELVWAQRLEGARAALSDPRRTGRVADIAAEFGFTAAEHFTRRFRARYGFSPRDLRPVAAARP